jgi:hypothetical protein
MIYNPLLWPVAHYLHLIAMLYFLRADYGYRLYKCTDK